MSNLLNRFKFDEFTPSRPISARSLSSLDESENDLSTRKTYLSVGGGFSTINRKKEPKLLLKSRKTTLLSPTTPKVVNIRFQDRCRKHRVKRKKIEGIKEDYKILSEFYREYQLIGLSQTEHRSNCNTNNQQPRSRANIFHKRTQSDMSTMTIFDYTAILNKINN